MVRRHRLELDWVALMLKRCDISAGQIYHKALEIKCGGGDFNVELPDCLCGDVCIGNATDCNSP